MARRKRARSSISSGREIWRCLGGMNFGATKNSKGIDRIRANERTNGVENIIGMDNSGDKEIGELGLLSLWEVE